MRDENEHQLWRDEVDAMAWPTAMPPPSKRVCGNGVDLRIRIRQRGDGCGWMMAAVMAGRTAGDLQNACLPVLVESELPRRSAKRLPRQSCHRLRSVSVSVEPFQSPTLSSRANVSKLKDRSN